MKKTVILFLSILLTIVIAGCSSSTEDNNTGLTIYTSIYPIQYIAEQIGGDTLNVKSIYPPGVDAHTYEPTTKEMTSIASSDAFIYMGAGMEGFAESAADALQSENVELMELGKNEELFHTEKELSEEHADDGHHHGDHDPHIWLDPLRMVDMAEMIKDKLIELNPDKTEQYTDNFVTLKDELVALDKQYQKTLQNKDNKEILVSHAAYGYWEERYGLDQIAISGLTSSDEPSQKELTQIIDETKELNINYVIFEQNGTDRISKVIQEQINAEALYIHNLSVLTDDDIKNEEDYLSLMKQNLKVLDKATE
ncbi:metal ABC transporter solute-binding protein, Zn/Mn family [Virgibacillus ndiopensis]|uniref:metal ABC transporter solute-binding protein, Zn/Mn family n=1 Tax=Virgibacillus ndiopensis TaxID=2004408 RepID=UPI000C0770B0|nr:zinc ABC transporter substrate-binding protein [Virgibacillus ndiopensis]